MMIMKIFYEITEEIFEPGDPWSSRWTWSTHEPAACQVFTLYTSINSIILLIIIMILIRIKYRLFAGQGEGKSFTDARQVREHFRY